MRDSVAASVVVVVNFHLHRAALGEEDAARLVADVVAVLIEMDTDRQTGGRKVDDVSVTGLLGHRL